MSKEQTPIEQILRTTLVIDNPKGVKYAVEKLEEQINTKVLEALEREVIEAYMNGGVDDEIYFSGNDNLLKEDAVKYYETEVKPKYNGLS